MAKKGAEWYFGLEHDELLSQALQRKVSTGKSAQNSGKRLVSSVESQPSIKVEELVKLVSELIECNFDSLFDSFRQFDVDEQGRLSKTGFREGVRALSGALKKINDAVIDELFICIDLDKDGAITLDEYIGFFNTNCRCTRAVVRSGSSVMPVATGLRLATARGDMVASDSHYHSRGRFNETASPQRAKRPYAASKVAHLALRAGTRHSRESGLGGTTPASAPDFERKNKWIDNMMKDLAVPWHNEPARMDGKWDKFLAECNSLDAAGKKTISVEGFRNSLTRTEPKLSVDQIEWFVKDAEKNEAGDIQYEVYAMKRKQQLQLISQPDDFKVLYSEAQIRARLRINYPSVQAAFKSMDVDRDGRISKIEFLGMLRKLQISLASRAIDAVFRHLDSNHDGYIDYKDFIKIFATHVPSTVGSEISDEEISTRLLQRFSNIADLFRSIDKDGDGLMVS
jgi:Ca2+-binding EF-hand superfamily protein